MWLCAMKQKCFMDAGNLNAKKEYRLTFKMRCKYKMKNRNVQMLYEK